MTKDNVHYRLPEKCCLNCIASTFDTYGGTVCKILNTDIDQGGICDYWVDYNNDVTQIKEAIHEGY